MNFSENDLGYFYEDDQCYVFFGKGNASIEKIKNHYPKLNFLRIKQTHSDICVQASEVLNEADAHWTYVKRTGLLIATADCIPLMVYCQQTNRILAIHAGWKGVANEITAKSLDSFIKSGSTKIDFKFWFGPHIRKDSFEISEDVFKQLQQVWFGVDQNYFSQKLDKYYVDLEEVVKAQILKTTGVLANYSSVRFDTLTNTNFHSYRRGKHTSERNLSFIYLK